MFHISCYFTVSKLDVRPNVKTLQYYSISTYQIDGFY